MDYYNLIIENANKAVINFKPLHNVISVKTFVEKH